MTDPPLCPACPVRRLMCPAAYDSRYCLRAARDPDCYRPIILWRARALGGAAGHPPPPWAYAGATRAALLVDNPGEDEGRWLEGLMRQCDPARVTWTGLALADGGRCDVGTARALARLLPLHAGPPSSSDPLDEERLVRRHRDAAAAVRQAGHGAEVLVAVGRAGPDRLTDGLGLPIVIVATGPDALPSCAAADRGAAPRRVALGPGSAAWSAPGLAPDVVVIPVGVEVEPCAPRVGRARQRAAWGLGDRDVAVGVVARSWPGPALKDAALVARLLGIDVRLVVIDASSAGRITPGDGPCDVPPGEDLGPVITAVPPGAHSGDVLAGLDVFLAAPAAGRGGWTPGLVEAWLAGVPVVAVGSLPTGRCQEYETLAVTVPGGPSLEALAAGVRAALGDQGRAAAGRARAVAWERLTAGAAAEQWAGLLQAVARHAMD